MNIQNFVENAMQMLDRKNGHEGFSQSNPEGFKMLSGVVSFLVVLAILLFVGKLLWNNILVVLVPAFKQVTSIWQLLGLHVLLVLLLGR